ncbi:MULTISPECIES: hypothetical protein [Amycolatopsis]|uniref:hypothetical protein n=1 Tax=Amycolatopsis TaxID=1813 RepID=UPI002106B540|nr:hypothetical protein [Amycolatopsis sp. TNS106]
MVTKAVASDFPVQASGGRGGRQGEQPDVATTQPRRCRLTDQGGQRGRRAYRRNRQTVVRFSRPRYRKNIRKPKHSRRAMSVETHRPEDAVEDVIVWLSNEFSAKLSPVAVGAIVRATHRDLKDQIVPEALDEMLHRLARDRIARLVRVL